jgi:transposase
MLSLKKIKQINTEADSRIDVLRLSMDAKERVKIGEFSRQGKSYAKIKALDHDFGNEHITPQGIFIPKLDEFQMFFTSSSITANFIVDMLTIFWENNKNRFKDVRRLVLNQDNGPECKSTRTQFIKRICEFSGKYNMEVSLAYYPPYHSKYNPVERVWGNLEQHWNGSLLDTVETVLKFAQSMKWKGNYPTVQLIENKYQTGVKLDKQTMNAYEKIIERDKELGKWFVEINPEKCKKLVSPELW